MAQNNSGKPGRLYFAYGSNLSTTQMRHRCPHSPPLGLAHLAGWTWIINERGYANIIPAESSAKEGTGSTAGTDLRHVLSQNQLPSLSPGHPVGVVYGLIYRLHPDDEAALDLYEGVGYAYEKVMMKIPRTDFDELHSVGGSSISTTKAPSKSESSQPPTEKTKTLHSGIMVKQPLEHKIELNDEIELLVYVDTINVTPSAPKEEYIGRMNRGIKEASEQRGLPAAYVNRVIRKYIPASL
ncbi:hypothetical protein GGR55DRAFT_153235 [Xylaria sp. FL0064]|nr:hypothetical protein GGR55DRAFT_153235 [Xylaria sp. FL0064]